MNIWANITSVWKEMAILVAKCFPASQLALDEENANPIIKWWQVVWNNAVDKQWTAFRKMFSNEMCEAEWLKQNNSSQSKLKTEEEQRTNSLFQKTFTKENVGDFTSKDNLSSWILSKSFSKQPLDPKIQNAVKIQTNI